MTVEFLLEMFELWNAGASLRFHAGLVFGVGILWHLPFVTAAAAGALVLLVSALLSGLRSAVSRKLVGDPGQEFLSSQSLLTLTIVVGALALGALAFYGVLPWIVALALVLVMVGTGTHIVEDATSTLRKRVELRAR